jgi:hypothetical protein
MVHDERHPLIGNMARLSPWQVRAKLETCPATLEELVEIGLEEFRRKNRRLESDDRVEVYRILQEYKTALMEPVEP